MSDAVAKLIPMLDALNEEERDELGRHLGVVEDVEMIEGELDEALVMEIERRIADYESGKTTPIDGPEFMARMRAKYG